MKKTKKNSGRRPKNFKKIAKRLAATDAAADATVVASQDRSAEAAQVIHDPMPDVVSGPGFPGLLFNMETGMAGMVAALSGVFMSTSIERKAKREGEKLEDSLTMDH